MMKKKKKIFWNLATFIYTQIVKYSYGYTWRASDIFLEFMLEEVLRGGLGAFDMWIAADDGTGKVASVKGGGVESEHAELLSRLLLLLDWKSTVVSFHDISSGGKSESYTHLLYPKEISILPTDSKFVTYLIIIFTRVNGEGWATFPVYPSFSIY